MCNLIWILYPNLDGVNVEIWLENVVQFMAKKSCKTGYPKDTSGFRVIGFPTDVEERKRWLPNLPNIIKLEDVTENMGICSRHWKTGFEYRIVWGFPRPLHHPTKFGSTPKSFASQATIRDRRSEDRGVTSEKRSMVSTKASSTKDIIRSWEDFCSFCRKIPLATEKEVKILKLGDSPLLIEFLISISKDYK